MDGIIQVIRVDAVKADNSNISFKGAGFLEKSVVKDTIANTLRQSKKLLSGGFITDIISEDTDALINGEYNITLHLKATSDLKYVVAGYGRLDDDARVKEYSTTFFRAQVKFDREKFADGSEKLFAILSDY